MGPLTNKRILLGVTGGIAAYKSAELIRELQRLGATVRVVMTPAATEFITPLTLQALSGNPVHLNLLDPAAEAGMGHIELARWADLILVAPATADFLAQLRGGEGSNLLLAICLASPAQIAIAPAMNQGMWKNPNTQNNINDLKQQGMHFIGPAAGEQACGDIGLGRMSEPGDICRDVTGLFETTILTGKTVVITAGPTREALDPVRYISNHSSGKMGYALASAAASAGAKTILISGPVSLTAPDRVTLINVTSAEQMYQVAVEQAATCNLFIGCAAVADYRPANTAEQKIKKTNDTMSIELTRNPDIVAAVANLNPKPFTVGFAAETEKLAEHAQSKLVRKKLDLVIANDVSDSSIGFNSDNNTVLLIGANHSEALPKMNKDVLAIQLIDKISKLMPSLSIPNQSK